MELSFQLSVATLNPGRGSVLPYEDLAFWERLEGFHRLAEIHGQDIGWLASKPLREIHGLAGTRVEDDQNPGFLRADVFQGVAVALGDIADIALVKRRLTVTATRAKERRPDRAAPQVRHFR